MIIGKKKEQIAVEFFNELTQPFLSHNLPQDRFHKKTEKNHNKFSSQNFVTSSQNNEKIQKYHTMDMKKFFVI